jgi:hypothetical protein
VSWLKGDDIVLRRAQIDRWPCAKRKDPCQSLSRTASRGHSRTDRQFNGLLQRSKTNPRLRRVRERIFGNAGSNPATKPGQVTGQLRRLTLAARGLPDSARGVTVWLSWSCGFAEILCNLLIGCMAAGPTCCRKAGEAAVNACTSFLRV